MKKHASVFEEGIAIATRLMDTGGRDILQNKLGIPHTT
jgi:hypothetical protein